MSDVTRILLQIESGDPKAAEQLLPLVYDELRKLAAVRMAQEKPGQTLQATALVHEAYVRLVDAKVPQQWDSRGPQVNLGAKNCNTGIHLLENGSPAESLPYFEKASASLQVVLARDSRIVSARQFLANSYGAKGRALNKLERHTEAIAAFDNAMEWVDESRKPCFAFMKARVVAKTQPEQAMSLVEEYLGPEKVAPDTRYDAACFYSHFGDTVGSGAAIGIGFIHYAGKLYSLRDLIVNPPANLKYVNPNVITDGGQICGGISIQNPDGTGSYSAVILTPVP